MRNYQEEFLCHYGVPGMKWGQRKQKGLTGRISGKRAAKKALKNQRKQIFKEYSSSIKVEKAKDNATLGTSSYNSKSSYSDRAYNQVAKKYGKKKLNDAIKANERRGNIAAMGSAAAGTAAVMAYLLLRK